MRTCRFEFGDGQIRSTVPGHAEAVSPESGAPAPYRVDDDPIVLTAAEPAMWFDTVATVTRIVHGRRAGDAGRALGLRFESLSAVAHVILRGYLRRFPRPAPRRAPPPAYGADPRP